jgi:hypothetical protein
MKAAVVHEFGQPLRIEDVPVPEPGTGEIIVKVETAGCATPTSMPPTVIGRSSPPLRSSQVTRGWGWSLAPGPKSEASERVTGQTKVIHQARALNRVNEAMAEVEADEVPARLVFEFR